MASKTYDYITLVNNDERSLNLRGRMRYLIMHVYRKLMYTANCFMAVIGCANAASALDPNATWLTEDGRVRVRVEQCGAKQEQICGYVVWMREPVDAKGHALLDESNPDPAKRSRRLLGHQLIMGLSPGSEGRFSGRIYSADNGKYYNITLWRESDKLQVRGCMISVLCVTQNWSLAPNIIQGQLVGLTGDPGGPKPDKEWVAPKPTKSIPVTKATK